MADRLQWAPGRRDAFREYLQLELRSAIDQRHGLEQKWLSWLRMYRAGPAASVLEFPWPGASNETIPAIATDVNQIYAKFMQTLHAAPNLWSVSALNERWVDVAKPMQDFLTLLDTSVLRMFNVNKRAVLEMCKLGTAIYKTGWTFEERLVNVYDNDGKVVPSVKERSVPFVDHVRLFDFVMPAYSFSIDPDEQGGAPWVAERIRISPDRLTMLAKSTEPDLPNILPEDLKKVLAAEEPSQTEYDSEVRKQETQRRLANEPPIEPPLANEVQMGVGSIPRVRQIELWEVHARYPARGRDQFDDIVVLWHQKSNTILRTTLNPYVHGQRPYDVIRYFPGEGFYGIGVAEQKETFQRVLSNLTNYAMDGALVSNAIMLGAKQGTNILPDEPLFLGKTIITEGNPRDELFPIQLGQPNGSLDNLIAMFQVTGERATGISDLQLGNLDSLPGRTPATSVVALLQEGARRPDLTIKDMRHEGLSRVGLKLIQLIQQYMSKAIDVGQARMLSVMTESLGNPEGPALASKMQTPLENAELGLGVSLSATSGTSNKEVDRQTSLALLQLAGQVAPQILQFTQIAEQSNGAQTQTGQVAMAAAKGLTELFRRALEQHDVRDSESIIPSVASQPGAQPLGLNPGSVPGGAGPDGSPGVGALPDGTGSPGGPAGGPSPFGAG